MSADELVLRKAKDTFDRTKMPIAGANSPVEVPQMWQQETANGIRILGTQSLETPTTSLLIKIPGGHYYEDKNKAGTASLLAAMLNETTTKRSAEDMSKALQLLGSSVSVSASNFYLNVSVSSLTKNIDATMDLVEEKLFSPAFLDEDFSRNKKQSIQGIKNSKKNAGYLSSTAYRQLMNGDNIAATPRNGTETSVAHISLDDVKAFYQQHTKPKNALLIVVSDRNEKQLEPTLSIFNDWKGEAPQLNLDVVGSTAKKGIIYLVNKDQAAQSAIRIGKRGLAEDFTGEFYQTSLMNFPLGGAFNSRINLNLREEKGYTYGARTFFWGNRLTGGYTATAQVRADVTDKSIVEFVKEITNYYENGVTDSELAFMKNAINQRDALKYETPSAKLGFLAQILEYDLTPKFVAEQVEIVNKMTKEKVNALAKKHLNIDEMLVVVVGSAETLRPQLEALGYEVVDYSI
jgi:zinc protease